MKRQLLLEDILEANKEKQKDSKGKSVFRIYEDARIIGTQIKDDLFAEKILVREGKDSKNYYSFRLSSDFEESGIMDRAYGTFLLITLLDGFKADFTRNEKNKLKNSIIDLLRYVQEHGFDASPYAKNENAAIFKNNNINFIESLTWAFSCFLFAHKLHNRERGDFDFSKEKFEIDKMVVASLKILIDNVIRKVGDKYELGWEEGSEDYVGWGAISGSKQPDLYFTNSVCETYGDLEDSVIGNIELKIERDQDYIDQLKSIADFDIIGRFEHICKIVGKNIYKTYGSQLGNEFFYQDGSVATKGQIEFSSQSPVLFNHLYAVMIPIYTNYHKDLESKDPEAFNVFQMRVKDGVDKVYKEYTDLLSKGKEGIVNRDTVSFFGVFEDKKSADILNKERINIAVLEALIVRARAQIVTYVTKYPEKELGEITSIIEKNRPNEELWIWGNIQETERAVSALKEFYDYYDDYEKKYAKISAEEEIRKAAHERELANQANSLKEKYNEDKKSLTKKYNQEIADLKSQVEHLSGLLNNGSPIEREIKKSIDECILERIDVILTERLEKITQINLGKDVQTSESDILFKRALDKYVMSYFTDAIKLSKLKDGRPNGYNDLTDEQILKNAVEAMNVFLSEMLPYVCLKGAEEDIKDIALFLGSSKSGVTNTIAKLEKLELKDNLRS